MSKTQKMSKMSKKAKYEIEVEGKKCRLTELDRTTLEITLGMIMSTTGSPQYIRAGEVILRNCWVDGDKEILERDDLLIAAAMKAYELIEIKEATLKKI